MTAVVVSGVSAGRLARENAMHDCFSQIDASTVADVTGLAGYRVRRRITLLRWVLGPHGDVRGRRILDVGCGSGVFSLLLALAGAEKVIGIDPAGAGASPGVLSAIAQGPRLGLTNLEGLAVTAQEFDLKGARPFDLVLAFNSLNHFDEEACRRLHRDEAARQTYRGLLGRIRELLVPDGAFCFCDVARHNIFSGTSRLGLFRGIWTRTIEWDLHQGPRLWRRLLREAGFRDIRCDYYVPESLRWAGPLLNNAVVSYLTVSFFAMRAAKPAAGGQVGELPAR